MKQGHRLRSFTKEQIVCLKWKSNFSFTKKMAEERFLEGGGFQLFLCHQAFLGIAPTWRVNLQKCKRHNVGIKPFVMDAGYHLLVIIYLKSFLYNWIVDKENAEKRGNLEIVHISTMQFGNWIRWLSPMLHVIWNTKKGRMTVNRTKPKNKLWCQR